VAWRHRKQGAWVRLRSGGLVSGFVRNAAFRPWRCGELRPLEGPQSELPDAKGAPWSGDESSATAYELRNNSSSESADPWSTRTIATVTDAGAGRILVVEDDATVAEVVARYLERAGFVVEAVGDGRAAVACAAAHPPDLVVLDLMLPGLDGFAVCRQLRAMVPVPIIMLTGRGQEHERVAGLELGADDYVVKPFSPRELTARVKSVLRRAQGTLAPLGSPGEGVACRLRAASLEVDVVARQASIGGTLVAFTAREFELLVFLMRNPRVVFRRDELLERVWGWTYGDTATVTVHVRRIREKIEADPAQPLLIGTVWGVGYRFEQPVEESARA